MDDNQFEMANKLQFVKQKNRNALINWAGAMH